ncbi:hypothetical protein AC578_5393, partial [Pseudocercospora eumusae]
MKSITVLASFLALFAAQSLAAPSKMIVDVIGGGGGGGGGISGAVCGTGQWGGCKREAEPEPEPETV